MRGISEFIHIIPSLEVYPRVYYFNKRYSDILDKFRRVTGKFTKLFANEKLDALHSTLEKGIEVRIYGETDLSPADYIPVALNLYRVQKSQKEGKENECPVDYIIPVDPVKDKPRASGGLEKEVDSEVTEHITSVGCSSVTVVVCHANIQRLDSEGLQIVNNLLEEVSFTADTPLRNTFLLCRSESDYTHEEKDSFRQHISNNIRNRILQDRIIIGTEHADIKSELSMFLESQCIQGLVSMKSVLQEYTQGQRRQHFITPFQETETTARQIQGFLRTVCGPVKEEFNFEQKLAVVAKCISVAALSRKYNLPVWLCNGILDTNNFQQKVIESFSTNTRYRLKKLKSVAKEPSKALDVPFDTILTVYSRRIASNLQKELRSTFADVEKPLSQFSSSVRKMLLEISSCLRKSNVEQPQNVETKNQNSSALDTDLRKDILRISGVYGVGTLYGEVEIHVNPEVSITMVESEIQTMMRKRNRFCSFTLKQLEKKPEIFVDNQYENGESIESLSPLRKGTLGGFVNGSDNHLYGLTCAHVVKGYDGQENNVFVKDGLNRQCLFAKSIPNLTVSTGENAKPLIDIAAVRIVDDMQDKCIKFLKDENGKIKPAVLAADRPCDLVGIFVYKYGAMSSLTKGLVCSDDYSVLSEDEGELEYIMLIDDYDDNDCLFAIPGDSGSTICAPDQNEVSIIKTVGILSAGHFKPAGYDTPLYFSFRLYDGLRKLTAKAGGIEFNFPQNCN